MFQAILGPIGAQIEPFQLATSSAKAKTIIRVTFRIHAPAFAHLQKNLHTFTSESWWATEKLYNNQLLRPKPSSWNLTFCSISGVKHTMICCGSTRYKSPRGTILGDLRCARSRHFKCPGQTIQEYNATNNWSEHQRFMAYRPSRTPHWDSLSQVCLGASNYFSNGNQVVGTWVGQLVVLFGSLVSPPSLKKTNKHPVQFLIAIVIQIDDHLIIITIDHHWASLNIIDNHWPLIIVDRHWPPLIISNHHYNRIIMNRMTSCIIIMNIVMNHCHHHHHHWSSSSFSALERFDNDQLQTHPCLNQRRPRWIGCCIFCSGDKMPRLNCLL